MMLAPRRPAIPALVCAAALTASLLAATSPARAQTPEVVRGRNVGEFQPVATENYFAWQQNKRAKPNRFDVFVMGPDGVEVKVNPDGKEGANGDIEGNLMVFQQYSKSSDIRFFDLVEHTRFAPPPGINTHHWEYWPSLSGKWLLFGRLKSNGTRLMFLYNVETGNKRWLDRVRNSKSFMAPGQVNGNYAVWSRCTPKTRCNVYLYDIATRERTQIPNPGKFQGAPSVSPEGTVYYVKTFKTCGKKVRLMRVLKGGEPEKLLRIPNGGDVSKTYVYSDDEGVRDLYYEHNVCADPAGSDLWKIPLPDVFDLSVEVGGPKDGVVFSSPVGINCPDGCEATFEQGTEVVLQALPGNDARFAGWTGDCSGQNKCTITMSEDKAVTATFAGATHNLLVSITGSGEVRSADGFIGCPQDCGQTYQHGETVVLEATAHDGGSVVWGGDCTGQSDLTCTLKMDEPKDVSATFGNGASPRRTSARPLSPRLVA